MFWLVNWGDTLLITIIIIMIIYLLVFSLVRGSPLKLKFEMSKYVPYLLFVILILGCFLRIYKLGEKSLWIDDLNSLRDSQSLSTAVMANHPPLFFIILHFFRYVGDNEFILRLPAAIFGILTILLIYKVGKLFFGTREALISAFLLSISTFHIDYSQQVRMYTVFSFFSVLSLFFLYKALKEYRKEFWAGFTLSTALVLYIHIFAILVVFAEVILSVIFLINQILKREKEPSIKRNFFMFVLSYIIISLLYVPWVSPRFSSLVKVAQTGLGWSKFIEAPPQLSFYITLLSDFGAGGGIALGIFLFFFLCGIIASVRDLEGISLLLWISLPTASVTVMSILLGPVIGTNSLRYLIFILPIYLLIISRGIVSFGKVAATQIVGLTKKPMRA